MNKVFNRLAVICCSMFIPVAAFAVDGTVLINQTNAIMGGVTPGDTPGFPVTISQTGSYKLSSNLVVPNENTTAIVITADGVSLDMNGFSIIGPTVCNGAQFKPTTSCAPLSSLPESGIGIIVGLVNGVSISNGTIRGMGNDGIEVGGAGARIDRVNALANGGTGISTNGITTNSTALFNLSAGFSFGGTALGNVAQSNGNAGFSGTGVTRNNQASSNGNDGIQVRGVIADNLAFGNSGSDIHAACGSTVIGNVGNVAFFNTTGAGCVTSDNANP
jgi:hypothetical protein